jgi:hypothetical protein
MVVVAGPGSLEGFSGGDRPSFVCCGCGAGEFEFRARVMAFSLTCGSHLKELWRGPWNFPDGDRAAARPHGHLLYTVHSLLAPYRCRRCDFISQVQYYCSCDMRWRWCTTARQAYWCPAMTMLPHQTHERDQCLDTSQHQSTIRSTSPARFLGRYVLLRRRPAQVAAYCTTALYMCTRWSDGMV